MHKVVVGHFCFELGVCGAKSVGISAKKWGFVPAKMPTSNNS